MEKIEKERAVKPSPCNHQRVLLTVGGVDMFASGLKSGALDGLTLSRTEQKSLHVAGIFFVLAIVFSVFSIASTVLGTVSLSGFAEKAIAAGAGVGTTPVAVLLGYWIDRKTIAMRGKRVPLVSAARPLPQAAMFGAAVCLAVIVTVASGALGDTYLSASAGATLCVAGIFGCLFGARFRARVARQARIPAGAAYSIDKVVDMGNPR
jgi:hypothetical protein